MKAVQHVMIKKNQVDVCKIFINFNNINAQLLQTLFRRMINKNSSMPMLREDRWTATSSALYSCNINRYTVTISIIIINVSTIITRLFNDMCLKSINSTIMAMQNDET